MGERILQKKMEKKIGRGILGGENRLVEWRLDVEAWEGNVVIQT